MLLEEWPSYKMLPYYGNVEPFQSSLGLHLLAEAKVGGVELAQLAVPLA